MTDLYQVLGVSASANDADIKAAYRDLAKELHPDRNGGDKKKTERFKEVSQAYTVLSDPMGRSKYDQMRSFGGPSGHARGGANAGFSGDVSDFMRDFARGGMPGNVHMPDLSNLNDLFADLFGAKTTRSGNHPASSFDPEGPTFYAQRGRDIDLNVKVSFAEAMLGSKTKVTHHETAVHGRVPFAPARSIEVTIPAGIKSGTKLRVAGQGGKADSGHFAGQAGDLFLHVEVASDPHLRLRSEGSVAETQDIETDVHLTVSEAALGTKIEVPTVDGKISLAIPPGTSSGCLMRLRGRGGRDPRTGRRGDQYCRIEIMIPEDAATDATKRRLFEELAKSERAEADRLASSSAKSAVGS